MVSFTTSPQTATEHSHYAIRFPHSLLDYQQDEEWCEVLMDRVWRRIRLHEYGTIFGIPGLYEQLFERTLCCSSPQCVIGLLADVLRDWPQRPTELSVIDLGAGNGMVAEQLRRLGVRAVVGADILPEAAEAAERDRPGLYDDYVVADLCDLGADDAQRLLAHAPNCLAAVAALGFADIPPRVFATALNLISTPGWLAFNIKETFLNGHDQTGFSRLLRRMSDEEIVQIQAYRRYGHRLSITGRRLHYVAMIARKLRGVPESLLNDL